jgi:hypothetical protein
MKDRHLSIIFGPIHADGQQTLFVVMGRQVSAEGISRPIIEGGRLRSGDNDETGIPLLGLSDGSQVSLRTLEIDRVSLFRFLQKISKWGETVRQGHPIMIRNEKSPEAPFLSQFRQLIHRMGAIAEGGPQVDQTGNLLIRGTLRTNRLRNEDKGPDNQSKTG